jgi:hypothetical protein
LISIHRCKKNHFISMSQQTLNCIAARVTHGIAALRQVDQLDEKVLAQALDALTDELVRIWHQHGLASTWSSICSKLAAQDHFRINQGMFPRVMLSLQRVLLHSDCSLSSIRKVCSADPEVTCHEWYPEGETEDEEDLGEHQWWLDLIPSELQSIWMTDELDLVEQNHKQNKTSLFPQHSRWRLRIQQQWKRGPGSRAPQVDRLCRERDMSAWLKGQVQVRKLERLAVLK